MKKLGLVFCLLLTAAIFSTASAQNIHAMFSDVKVYNNGDGTGTVEATLTPNGSDWAITEMRISGGPVFGLSSITISGRNNPFLPQVSNGPGNSGSSTVVVDFPAGRASENGPEFVTVEVLAQRRVGNHMIQDSFSASHAVRDR